MEELQYLPFQDQGLPSVPIVRRRNNRRLGNYQLKSPKLHLKMQ